jgi:hypothetical protein
MTRVEFIAATGSIFFERCGPEGLQFVREFYRATAYEPLIALDLQSAAYMLLRMPSQQAFNRGEIN